MIVGEGCQRRDVRHRERRVRRHLRVQEPGVLVDGCRPGGGVERVRDPAHADAPLLRVPHEQHERAAVAPGGGDEVGRGGRARGIAREEGVRGEVHGGHAGARDDGGRLQPRPVGLEQRERLLEVVGGGVRDPRVAPRRHQVAERGLEMVAVLEVLRRRAVGGLDEAALVGGGREVVVEAVDGDGVEPAGAGLRAGGGLGGGGTPAPGDPRVEAGRGGRGGRGGRFDDGHRAAPAVRWGAPGWTSPRRARRWSGSGRCPGAG